MTTVFLAPDPINGTQFIPGSNTPAAGAKLFFYAQGTSTKQNAYTTSLGNVAWSNPIVLDSGGNLGGSGEVWIPAGLPAKFVLAPFNDTDPPISPLWSRDNISGINDTTVSVSEWIAGPLPTYINATTFTLVGDQTPTFTVGRRIKTTNTGGTVYSTILTSVFTTFTTITIDNDSGTLDAGLSAIRYGLLNEVNQSIPAFIQSGTGAVPRTVQSKDRDIVSVKDFGAVGDGVADDTSALQAALNSGRFLILPQGTYKYTNLVFDLCPGMDGEGIYQSVLSPTSVAGNSIVFGSAAPTCWGEFSNFGINGNATTLTGIKLGTSRTNYTCNLTFRKVRIENFSATNARGVIGQAVQDTRLIDCVVQRNYTNFYRPDTTSPNGFLTTLTFEGKATSLDLASGPASILCDGEIGTLTIGGTIRSCAAEAIRTNAPTLNINEGNILVLDGTFFEQNNTGNTGTADINVTGPAGAQNQLTLIMNGAEFHTQANSMNQLNTDNVVGVVQDCPYLDTAKIATTANSQIYFRNSQLLAKNSSPAKTNYGALLGQILAEDKEYSDAVPFVRGFKQFVDGFWLGLANPNAVANTAAGFKLVTGNVSFGDCSAGVSKGLFRLYAQNANALGLGRRDNTSAVFCFFRVNQTSDSARSRGACGLLMSASTDPSAAIAVTPNVSVTSSVPTQSDATDLTVAAYSVAGGTPSNVYTADTTFIDAGLTVTSAAGGGNQAGSISVSYVALIAGDVTQL